MNFPTESEVRASLWTTNSRLREYARDLEDRLAKSESAVVRQAATIKDLMTQRTELLDDTERLLEYVLLPGSERGGRADAAKRMCQIIREEMETE